VTAASRTQSDDFAINEIVIQVDDQRFWLYPAIDPETNAFPHVRLFPTRTTVLTNLILREHREKHDVKDSHILIDGTPWLKAALFEERLL
jgi:transposase-like protein